MNKLQELSLEALDQVSGGGDVADSLGDMSTVMQMRMQMYMDSRTKCFEVLSNVLHKMGNTSGAIVQNLK
jgi:hypothetical protein